jgi:hypothetical protein
MQWCAPSQNVRGPGAEELPRPEEETSNRIVGDGDQAQGADPRRVFQRKFTRDRRAPIMTNLFVVNFGRVLLLRFFFDYLM